MASSVAAMPERITALLINEGIVSRELVERAQRDAKQNGTTVTLALIRTGAIQEVELTKIIARTYKMPAVDLSKFEVDQKILRLVPADLALKHCILPLKREGRTLTVAVADPTDQGILEDLKFVTRYDIFPVLAAESTLRAVIDKQYDQGDVAMDSLLKDIAAEGDFEVLENDEEDMNAAALAAAVDDAPGRQAAQRHPHRRR
jgi:type IV pilus assembly protein PilB